MNPAQPPLLLGPADLAEASVRERRARRLGALAKRRRANAWGRLAANIMAAGLAAAIFNTPAPLVWVGMFVLVVLIDRAAFVHLGARCDAGDPPPRMPWFIAWTALQSSYANALSVILWFVPHESGPTMAVMFLCGSLANTATTMRNSPALAAAAIGPTMAYLVGLPIAQFALGGGGDGADLVPLIGAVLLLVWGFRLWKSLLTFDQANAQAEASASRERQAAAAAAAAKTDVIQRMNDELRTPLAALQGAAEYLRRVASSPQARAHLANLKQASDGLQLVLDDISALERSDALASDPAPADPRELARGIVSSFRAAAQDKNLELFLDIAPDAPSLVAVDSARLRQILSNLVSNAVRYTSHGGVRVTLAANASETPGIMRLRFEVSDTGRGLSRAHLAVLFGRNRSSVGEGQGLAISLRLARLMDASLTAKSELGQGAVFTLALDAPVVAGAEARSAA